MFGKVNEIYASFQNNFWIQNVPSSLSYLYLDHIIPPLVCKLCKPVGEISTYNIDI